MDRNFPRTIVVGCGAVCLNDYLPAFKRLKWHPVAFVDPILSHAEAAASQFEHSAALHSLEDLKHFGAEAAVVSTPPKTHFTVAQDLLKSGIHLLIEKPLATTSDEGESILKTAEQHDAKVAVGHNRRYLVSMRLLKEILDREELGQIRRFALREGGPYEWPLASPSSWSQEMSGGGVLLDLGGHSLDLIGWLFGATECVSYEDDNRGGVEADALVRLRTAADVEGTVELSRTRTMPNTLLIEGERGIFELRCNQRNEVLRVPTSLKNFEAHGFRLASMPRQDRSDCFVAELQNLRDMAVAGTEPRVPGREAIRSVKLIENCYANRSDLKLPWLGQSLSVKPRPGRWLVTGATGFIGGHVVEQLASAGSDVTAFVRKFSRGARIARSPIKFLLGDISDERAVLDAVDGMDVVVNCVYDGGSADRDLRGIENLVRACARSSARLVHIGSFATYGPPQDGRITEATPTTAPDGSYSDIKLRGENLALGLGKELGAEVIVIQPTIVYGPHSRYRIHYAAEKLLAGYFLLPDVDGLCHCVYIDDLVKALVLAGNAHGIEGERFLISGPAPVPWPLFYGAIDSTLGTSRLRTRPLAEIRAQTTPPTRWGQIVRRSKRALVASYAKLPDTTKRLGRRIYDPQPREPVVHTPAGLELELYTMKATVSWEKAHRLLSYTPDFDFESGGKLTTEWVRFAYEYDPRSPVRAHP